MINEKHITIRCVWSPYRCQTHSGAVTATHHFSVNKKHREIHQNPGGQHEDHGIKAQDVEEPQVVYPCVAQHLKKKVESHTDYVMSLLTRTLLLSHSVSNTSTPSRAAQRDISFTRFTSTRSDISISLLPPGIMRHIPAGGWFTFLEKMFCIEKQSVAARALINPETWNDISVAVASSTPPMMGMSDVYTYNKEHTEREARGQERKER